MTQTIAPTAIADLDTADARHLLAILHFPQPQRASLLVYVAILLGEIRNSSLRFLSPWTELLPFLIYHHNWAEDYETETDSQT